MGRVANFAGVGDYKAINGGQYELEVLSFEWKDPKDQFPSDASKINPATGKAWQYSNVKISVVDETDDQGNRIAGHVLFDKFSENPKSLFALKRAAIAFGEDPDMFEDEDGEGRDDVDLDVVLQNMVGRKALGTVVKKTFKREDGSLGESNEITRYESVEQPIGLSASRR